MSPVQMESDGAFGLTWAQIQHAQRGGIIPRTPLDTTAPGDYGADPVGDGTFRMVPSGDVVSHEERNRRLAARGAK